VVSGADTFEQFFAREHDRVLRSIEGLVGDHELAVDATQDAFIKAHLHWPTVSTYDSPAAWVRRAAINASRDQQRSERRRRDREHTVVAGDVVGASDNGDHIAADEAARELLSHLSARQREVATRFYVDDRSIDDIAEALGVSVGTVKSQLSEARQRLRRSVRP
jgi:RNA polymerase sigma-70 factor (ECF subfamily)